MEYSFSKVKKLDFNDLDMNLTWRVSYMLNEFAEVATQHAQEIGAWDEKYKGIYGWIVSKQRFKIFKPVTAQTITIKTWVGKGSSVIFPRYYAVYDENHELLVEGCAIWTLLDLKKRRIVPPTRVGLTYPMIENEENIEKPESIEFNEPFEHSLVRKVLFSDIDVHQHMNNARYMEWANDIINYDEILRLPLKEFTIHYKKEIQPLSEIRMDYIRKEHLCLIQGKDAQDTIHFEIECIL